MPSPAQARPGARSARPGRALQIVTQAASEKETPLMRFPSWLRRRPAGGRSTRTKRTSCRPLLERLEDRLAPAVVTNISDSGPGSLRQAILDANASAGPDVITFA